MQRFLAMLVLTIVVLTCDDSQAANRRLRANTTQTNNVNTATNAPVQQRPFSRLMEIERRKNAALRQMFFGR
jgi:hypothetical protein